MHISDNLTRFIDFANTALQGPSGEKSVLRLEGDSLATGAWQRLGKRSDDYKTDNRAVRQALIDSLKEEFGGIQSLPKSVLKALNIRAFSLEDGTVTSQKPLTARRVKMITDAVQAFRKEHISAAAMQLGAQENLHDPVYFNDKLRALEDSFNTFSDKGFTLGDMFQGGGKNLMKTNPSLQQRFEGVNKRTYLKNAAKLTNNCLKLTFFEEMKKLENGEVSYFEGDQHRTLMANEKGQCLPNRSGTYRQALDELARQATHDPNATYDSITPEQRTKVHIACALLTQRSETAVFQGFSGALTPDHNTMDAFCPVGGKIGTDQASFYSCTFDDDGGISISINRYRSLGELGLGSLPPDEDGDIESLDFQGDDMKSFMRLDIHIKPEEVERLSHLGGEFKSAEVDEILEQYNQQERHPPVGFLDRFSNDHIPANLQIDMEVTTMVQYTVA